MMGSCTSGSPTPRFLRAHVRGNAPESLFADRPDAVRDVVDEAPLAFRAFRQHGGAQVSAASELHALPVGAVAVARVLEKQRGGKRLVGLAEERSRLL